MPFSTQDSDQDRDAAPTGPLGGDVRPIPKNVPMSAEEANAAFEARQPVTDESLGTLLAPPEQVLSTLNRDGSRRWLQPRVSAGQFLSARRWVAYALIAIFTLLPFARIGGKPFLLLDLAHREFTFFGKTLLVTDTILLAFFMLSVFVTIFLVTALAGRVWCGWACPQTVYMEFVYRPLERLFEGTAGRGGKASRKTISAKLGQFAVYLGVSMILAHTFLAYFVGTDALANWLQRSPLEHPGAFLVMAATTALMLFNFGYFREQTCLLACPYGRIQSALLDRNSLIVSYDTQRGEPRGRARQASIALPVKQFGDCVDCGLCVVTCPTGIDIRRGLQMECVGCAQCIDACDSVMTKVGRPRGLIRYTSQARLAGEKGRLIRPRVIIYSLILAALLTALSFLTATRPAADVEVMRGLGLPFSELPDGTIANPIRIKITNRTEKPATYTMSVATPENVRLQATPNPLELQPRETQTLNVLLLISPDALKKPNPTCQVQISDGQKFEIVVPHLMLGPAALTGG